MFATLFGDKCRRELPLWKSKYLSTTFCCISFGIYLYLLAIDGCPSSTGIRGTLVGFSSRLSRTTPVLHNHLLCEKHLWYFHTSNRRIPKCLEIANIDFLFRARQTISDYICGRHSIKWAKSFIWICSKYIIGFGFQVPALHLFFGIVKEKFTIVRYRRPNWKIWKISVVITKL